MKELVNRGWELKPYTVKSLFSLKGEVMITEHRVKTLEKTVKILTKTISELVDNSSEVSQISNEDDIKPCEAWNNYDDDDNCKLCYDWYNDPDSSPHLNLNRDRYRGTPHANRLDVCRRCEKAIQRHEEEWHYDGRPYHLDCVTKQQSEDKITMARLEELDSKRCHVCHEWPGFKPITKREGKYYHKVCLKQLQATMKPKKILQLKKKKKKVVGGLHNIHHLFKKKKKKKKQK